VTAGKWGESFLKSGMPLEHVVLVAFRSLNYVCEPGIEYECCDGDEYKFRELDLDACSSQVNQSTCLHFLVECKYHDPSRHWFFLPHERHRWYFNDRVFNCGPMQTLSRPRAQGALNLAPLSYMGLVVSEDGTKQDNAVDHAVRQLASAFVPWAMSRFAYILNVREGRAPMATAIVPMVVTNAKVFRIRPELTSLAEMREAKSPADIADEVAWTWCFFDPSREQVFRNRDTIDQYLQDASVFGDEFRTLRMAFSERPNWIAVVNLEHLAEAIGSIESYLMSLATRDTWQLMGVLRKPW
jgi:hypothetical protein